MSGLDKRERKLCDLIAKQERSMREALAAHVAIPTGRGHAPGLEKYRALLIESLTDLGATVEIVEGDPRPAWLDSSDSREAASGLPIVIATRHANETSPRILIAGHMDTVHDPQGSFREMIIDPEDSSIARGPGVADMKGGIVITLHALRALADAGIEVNWTVLLNADEETGSFQSARVLRETAKRHEVGICVEPALPDGAIATSRMGSGQFMIEVFGRAAHVGREFEKGVSAVYQLAEIITGLSKLAKPDEGAIVNVGPLRAPGSATNVVPDYAACWGNVRYRDPAAGDRLAKAIDALRTGGDQLPRVIVHRSWNRPAKPADDQVLALAGAVQSIAGDLGQPEPQLVSTGGVCDGNILQDAGLPTIDTLGVRGGNLHRPDEFIELPSIVERCQLLAALLIRLADGRVTLRHAAGGAETGR